VKTESNQEHVSVSDKLSELLQGLALASMANQTHYKELLRDIEREIVAAKNPQQHLVAKLAIAANKTSTPADCLINWLDTIDATVNQDTAIRGLMLDPVPNSRLIQILIARSLTTSRDAVKGTFSSRALGLTPQFYKDLKKSVGQQHPRMGVAVWDAAEKEMRGPEWCEAWSQFSMNILSSGANQSRTSLAALSSEYAIRLTEADSGCANSLSRFLLFLQTAIGVPNEVTMESVRNSPVGQFLKKQLSMVCGDISTEASGGNFSAQDSPLSTDRSIPAKTIESIQRIQPGLTSNEKIELKSALPKQLTRAVEVFCEELHSHLQSSVERGGSGRELVEQIKKKDDLLRSIRMKVETLEGRLSSSSEQISRMEQDKVALNKVIRDLEMNLLKKDQLLAQHNESSTKQRAQLEQLTDDYNHLDKRSEQLIAQSRKQVMLDLDMQLREQWEMTARMIEMVISKNREPELLGKMWNELDHILWEEIGKTGFQVRTVS